jgi:hypothetical protein
MHACLHALLLQRMLPCSGLLWDASMGSMAQLPNKACERGAVVAQHLWGHVAEGCEHGVEGVLLWELL